MKMQFFTVPAHCPEDAQQNVNAFIAQHRLVTIEKHFVASGTEAFGLCATPTMTATRKALERLGFRQQ